MMMLTELIDLLICGLLDPIERDEIITRVQNAPQDLEFSWTSSPEEAMSIELMGSLADYSGFQNYRLCFHRLEYITFAEIQAIAPKGSVT